METIKTAEEDLHANIRYVGARILGDMMGEVYEKVEREGWVTDVLRLAYPVRPWKKGASVAELVDFVIREAGFAERKSGLPAPCSDMMDLFEGLVNRVVDSELRFLTDTRVSDLRCEYEKGRGMVYWLDTDKDEA